MPSRAKRIVVVGPPDDPDDPLDRMRGTLLLLAATEEVEILRAGQHTPGDAALRLGRERRHTPILAVGAFGVDGRLAREIAARFPVALVFDALDHLSEPPGSGDLADPVGAVLRGDRARTGAGLSRYRRTLRAAAAPSRDMLKALQAASGAEVPGGLHVLQPPVDRITAQRLIDGAVTAGGVVAAGLDAGQAHLLLRGAALSGFTGQLTFCGPEPRPRWPLAALAAGFGLSDRVRWVRTVRRGCVARLVAGSGAVVVAEGAPFLSAADLAVLFTRPLLRIGRGKSLEDVTGFLREAVPVAGPVRIDEALATASSPSRLLEAVRGFVDAAVAGSAAFREQA